MEFDSVPLEPGIALGIEADPWRGFGLLDKLILVALPLLALGAVLLLFLDQSLLRRLTRVPGFGSMLDWLVNSHGSWIAGVGLFLLWFAFLAFKRWRIVSNEHQWVDAGCPQCQEHELVRVSRERSDRWYGLVGIPAYRYACRNCTWRGLRIAHRHRHIVLAQEEMITASSLTLDAPGLDYQGEISAANLAPLSEESYVFEEPAGQVPATYPDIFLGEDELNRDELQMGDPSEAEPVQSQEATAANRHNNVEPSEDDLDWLWRRLSDDS